ncbi:hypothetical protein TKK_0000336 [Trichogramma kaykai]
MGLVIVDIFARATLAEKEVSVLKEQLASASANDTANVKTEGSNNAQSTDQNQNQDSSNNRRTPNANHEQELQAKDRESGTVSLGSLPGNGSNQYR